MSMKLIREIERKIAKQVIDDCLAAGCILEINHDDDESETISIKDSSEATLDEFFACDQEQLYVDLPNGRKGSVLFIFGNDGYDVISDYTVNMEELLTNANRLADQYG